MGKYEDAIEALKEQYEVPDSILESLAGTGLRKQADRAAALEKENSELKERNRKLETAPQIHKALEKAGVDFDNLRKAEVEVIDKLDVGEDGLTDEWAADIVSAYELPIKEGFSPEEGESDEPKAAEVARHAQRAPSGGGTVGSGLTPEKFAEWPQERRLKFREEHKEEFDRLRRGETVTGIAV